MLKAQTVQRETADRDRLQTLVQGMTGEVESFERRRELEVEVSLSLYSLLAEDLWRRADDAETSTTWAAPTHQSWPGCCRLERSQGEEESIEEGLRHAYRLSTTYR